MTGGIDLNQFLMERLVAIEKNNNKILDSVIDIQRDVHGLQKDMSTFTDYKKKVEKLERAVTKIQTITETKRGVLDATKTWVYIIIAAVTIGGFFSGLKIGGKQAKADTVKIEKLKRV